MDKSARAFSWRLCISALSNATNAGVCSLGAVYGFLFSHASQLTSLVDSQALSGFYCCSVLAIMVEGHRENITCPIRRQFSDPCRSTIRLHHGQVQSFLSSGSYVHCLTLSPSITATLIVLFLDLIEADAERSNESEVHAGRDCHVVLTVSAFHS